MAHNVELGRRGEDLAAAHLRACGMTIVERNWRCARGEIDIIAHDGDETVFVEVKTRSGGGWGHPFESITPAKVARLRRLAATWCEERVGGASRIRLDAIAVLAPLDAPAFIERLESIG